MKNVVTIEEFFLNYNIISKVLEDNDNIFNTIIGYSFSNDETIVKINFSFSEVLYFKRLGITEKISEKEYYLYIFQKNQTVDLFKLKFKDLIENFEDFSDILDAGTENEKYIVKYLVINNNAENKEKLKIFKVISNEVIFLDINLKNIVTDKFQRIEFISDNGKTFFVKEKDKYTFRKLKKDRTVYFEDFRRIERFFICLTKEKKLEIYNFNGEKQYQDYEIIQKDLYDKNIRFLDLKNDKKEKKSILIRAEKIIEIEKIRLLKFNDEIKYIILREIENEQKINENQIVSRNIKRNKRVDMYTAEGTLVLENMEILNPKGAKESKNQNVESIICKYIKGKRVPKRSYDNDENKEIIDEAKIEFFYLKDLGTTFIRDITNTELEKLKYKNIFTFKKCGKLYIIFCEIYFEDLYVVNFAKVSINENFQSTIIYKLDNDERSTILKDLRKIDGYNDDLEKVKFKSYGEKNEIKIDYI